MSDISELLNVVNDQIESSSSHIKKTKAYKMYIEANKDCHDTSKLHYLQRVVQQIEAGVLDKRHLIATKGSGRTLKSFMQIQCSRRVLLVIYGVNAKNYALPKRD